MMRSGAGFYQRNVCSLMLHDVLWWICLSRNGLIFNDSKPDWAADTLDVSSLEFGRARKVRNWWGFKRSPWTFLCISSLAAGIKESNETEVLAIRRAMRIGAATTLVPQIDWNRFFQSDTVNAISWLNMDLD